MLCITISRVFRWVPLKRSCNSLSFHAVYEEISCCGRCLYRSATSKLLNTAQPGQVQQRGPSTEHNL